MQGSRVSLRSTRAADFLRAAAQAFENTPTKTYPRSLPHPYHSRVRFAEGAFMRRHASGAGCGACGDNSPNRG
jgi:hypothetical protein